MTSSIFKPPEGRTVIVKDGTYDLLGGKGYYWGEISQSEFAELLTLARDKGYVKAAAEFGTKYPGFYEYIVSYLRGDWLFDCIDFSRTKRCLDIGSGWGAITFALSYQFDEVWSLEAVRERLEFQKIRAQQEGKSNIRFVRSDWLKLPFTDNSFDLVCANGVLEWIGLSDFSRNPKELQLAFLREVRRVLKPGGCIYLGIENRYALFLLLGAKDHSGLPFTSILPRRLADLAVKIFRGKEEKFVKERRIEGEWQDYRTYTYSLWGYEKLFKKAGFADSEVNWAISYNAPAETGKFDGESFHFLLNLYREHDFNVTFVSYLATALGAKLPPALINIFFPLVTPNFLIYGYKGGRSKGIFKEKLLKLNPGITSYVRRSGTHGLSSKVNFIFLKDGKPQSILKLARFRQFAKHLEEEAQLLTRWNQVKIEKRLIDGREVFLEPYLQGKICQTDCALDNKRAIEWLISFQCKTAVGYWIGDEFDKKVKGYLKVLPQAHLSEDTQKKINGMISNFLAKTNKMKIPKVAEHGDFVKTNILFGDSKTYVLDWEFYEEEGDPFFDFVFFLINNSMVGKMPEAFRKNFTGKGKYSSKIKFLIDIFSKKSNIASSLILESVSYVLARGLYRRFEDEARRHLDIQTFMQLIEVWVKIYPETKRWLNND